MMPGDKLPRHHLLRMDEGMWTTLRVLHGIRGGSFASTVRFVLRVGLKEVARRQKGK